MKIAFFGSSLISAYWNGAATYYRGILKYLHRLGHDITFYEPDILNRRKHRDIPDPPYARSVIYKADTEQDIKNVVRSANTADVVVKASGVGIYDDLLTETVLELTKAGGLSIFWDVDAPATLSSIESNKHPLLGELIQEYDWVLTYGGGDPVVGRYRRLGAERCVPIYNALDPEEHFPVRSSSNYKTSLGLLANRLPDREDRIAEFFFSAAQQLPQDAFLLGGSGWQSFENLPDNVRYIGHVSTEQHNAFNSSALAILNVSRDSMAQNGFSPATRVFEAVGAEACLISDAWEGLELFLEPNKECLVASTGQEVAVHLSELTPKRARELGLAGRKRLLTEHTYRHRAEIVHHMLLKSASPPTLSEMSQLRASTEAEQGKRIFGP